MKRVLIIGCAGSGKSTLARALAQRTGLPGIHLDREFWQPGWVEPDRAHWHAKVDALAEGPAWIIDGNYRSALPRRLARADTVIHLDLPRRTCLWRVLWRTLRHRGRTRADMPENCPERFDWEFLLYIWRYPRTHRPDMVAALQDFGGTKVELRNRRDVVRYLAGIDGVAERDGPGSE